MSPDHADNATDAVLYIPSDRADAGEQSAEKPLLFSLSAAHHYSKADDVELFLVLESMTGGSWSDELNALLDAQGVSVVWRPGTSDD